LDQTTGDKLSAVQGWRQVFKREKHNVITIGLFLYNLRAKILPQPCLVSPYRSNNANLTGAEKKILNWCNTKFSEVSLQEMCGNQPEESLEFELVTFDGFE